MDKEVQITETFNSIMGSIRKYQTEEEMEKEIRFVLRFLYNQGLIAGIKSTDGNKTNLLPY
jgi:hypothetical protein